MTLFRFQDLEIWKDSIELANELFDIADQLEGKRLFRFAEQLRGASLSVSNNIAEGSGSIHNKDFVNFLNFARRSVFENANMLIVFEKRKLLKEETLSRLLEKLQYLSRKISKFQQSLKR